MSLYLCLHLTKEASAMYPVRHEKLNQWVREVAEFMRAVRCLLVRRQQGRV